MATQPKHVNCPRTLVLLLACAVLAVAGCGNTGGNLIVLPFRAGGVQRAGPGPLTFTTAHGWTVTLQTARIALGPFYFNVSPPPQSSFRGGVVIIEATEQVVVDPLDPRLYDVPGGADGETGTAVAVEIGLFPADAMQSPADQSLLGGNVGFVAGTATKGGMIVPFSGPIAIDTSLVTPQTPLVALEQVPGAVVDLTFTATPQALELRVDPSHWFDQSDFSQLLQGSSPTGAYGWDTHSTFLNQLVQGVKGASGVYGFQGVAQ